eukprot:5660844-Ditylum_brightwellii.AAC.1
MTDCDAWQDGTAAHIQSTAPTDIVEEEPEEEESRTEPTTENVAVGQVTVAEDDSHIGKNIYPPTMMCSKNQGHQSMQNGKKKVYVYHVDVLTTRERVQQGASFTWVLA